MSIIKLPIKYEGESTIALFDDSKSIKEEGLCGVILSGNRVLDYISCDEDMWDDEDDLPKKILPPGEVDMETGEFYHNGKKYSLISANINEELEDKPNYPTLQKLLATWCTTPSNDEDALEFRTKRRAMLEAMLQPAHRRMSYKTQSETDENAGFIKSLIKLLPLVQHNYDAYKVHEAYIQKLQNEPPEADKDMWIKTSQRIMREQLEESKIKIKKLTDLHPAYKRCVDADPAFANILDKAIWKAFEMGRELDLQHKAAEAAEKEKDPVQEDIKQWVHDLPREIIQHLIDHEQLLRSMVKSDETGTMQQRGNP